MLYTTPVWLGHTDALPVMLGVDGDDPTDTESVPVTEPQLLLNTHVTLPDTAEALQLVVMELLPCPAVMVTPVGTVQA